MQGNKIKDSDIPEELGSDNFAITNYDYGRTGELVQCTNCGFIQCTDLNQVIHFYEDLRDEEYENTRNERKLQEKKVIEKIAHFKPSGRLLDIGAGSGIMVETALEKGYGAEGVEPSKWLQELAQKHGLPVHQGVFPHSSVKGEFDIIACIDVIEHVVDPAELLQAMAKQLKNDGILVLVTPDVRSFPARLLKFRWWHFRVAHIGYFNKRNLNMLAERCGFRLLKMSRPTWYFTMKYLLVRLCSFFPEFMRFKPPAFTEKMVIPVNLRDSWMAFYTLKHD